MTAPPFGLQLPEVTNLFSRGGTAGALIRSIDWSKTSLGPSATWCRSLRSTVNMVLSSRHPMFMWWGPDLIQFYNDAYLPSFGRGKHPRAMGQHGRDCWQEIWPIISPQIDDVMLRGVSSWNEDALVPIERNGRIEEVYWTYGYSPLFDDDGQIAGTLVVCTETTRRVIAERRSQLVHLVGDRIAACHELQHLLDTAKAVCAEARNDVPFLLIYREDRTSGEWHLSGSAHLSDVDLAAVDACVRPHLGEPAREGLLRNAVAVGVQVEDAIWPEPITHALIVRSRNPGPDVFVFGISPRLPLDTAYEELFDELVEQIDGAAARLEVFRLRAVVDSERRNLLLQAPVATALLTGPRHVFELANPLYREIVGGRDVVGKAYVDAFPEIAGTPLAGVLDRVYLHGEPFVSSEYLIPLDRTGQGALQDCFFRFNLEPLRDAQGQVYGMMAVAVDITEQVRARRVLETATLEREAMLARLEAGDRAKDEFLATVSHELRTPLTSMLGWARLLRSDSDPQLLGKGLEVIERSARAQARLIEDILDVSRITSGKFRMSIVAVDVAAVVNASLETVRPTAASKRVRLLVEMASDLPTVHADEDRLQQVIWNLLSNGVKFTPQGGEVSLAARVDGEDLLISVRDTGRGIARAFLPHVFDRFRQDDASTTKQNAGLGLGLAIVRHLVELHGGTVTAHSDGEGCGSRFEVRLPVLAAELLEHHSVPVGVPSEGVPSTRGQINARLVAVRVLLVDDQLDARELVATVLEGAGAIVTQAGSVAAALAALQTQQFAVIVSDIAMPGIDGYELIQRLRAGAVSEHSRDIPALALTAGARQEDRERALGSGFQAYVVKPIDPASLVERVAALLCPR